MHARGRAIGANYYLPCPPRRLELELAARRALPVAPAHDRDKGRKAMAQQGDDPSAAPPPAEPPGTSLFAAIRANDVQRLERALSGEGASVDGTVAVKEEEATEFFSGTMTALMLAVGLGHNRVARLLLERGADVHARGCADIWCATALHIAADFGNVEMIVALGAAGSDLSAADADGGTPIWIGERRG